MEERKEERKNILNSRLLYAFAWAAAVITASASGLTAAVALCISQLTDASRMTAEELQNAADWGWSAFFSPGHGRDDFFSRNITLAIVLGLAALIFTILVCVMTGRFDRDEEDRIRLNWFDKLWSEVHILIVICGVSIAAMLAGMAGRMVKCDNRFGVCDFTGLFKTVEKNDYLYGISNDAAFWYIAAGIILMLAAAGTAFVTLVKKIKAGELIRRSLFGILLGWLGWSASKAGEGAAAAGKGIAGAVKAARGRTRSLTVPADTDRGAVRKLIFKYCLAAVVLITLPIALFILFGGSPPGMLAGWVIAVIAALRVIVKKVARLSEIRAGVIEVKSGNLTHKISVLEDDNGPKTDLDKLASDINHISEATNVAVQNEIRNQRLKTDLISNVSHDLKTPLTSMVSYLDILEKEGLDSPDAPKHLAIVREKTDRLRTLTEELFEAAKASSGNIPCEIENIDLAALIDQSLAEMEDRLNKKKLKIRKNIRSDSTLVRADGKLLYRVLENLLSNISKYALERSRVYIDVTDPGASPEVPGRPVSNTGKGRLLLEVKNISKAELNISAEELMERFTRGDESRNTEGSGLGLAIAKDLTALMGGVFEISIDGDMFKASVLLNKA